MPFKKYGHEPSKAHNFKFICIPVKMVSKFGRNFEEIKAYIKVGTNSLNCGKFICLIRYLMRQMVGCKRNTCQSLSALQQHVANLWL